MTLVRNSLTLCYVIKLWILIQGEEVDILVFFAAGLLLQAKQVHYWYKSTAAKLVTVCITESRIVHTC